MDRYLKGDVSAFGSVLATLFRLATEYDAELVEINPLAKVASGEFVAADARIILDDNALFRHPEFSDRGLTRADDSPREAEARRQDLTYVDLSGDIGIVGNGAGLVMATMDLIRLHGGEPANFLDIGGGAQAEVIRKGLTLVMSKPEVKAVLINVLGGITRCDEVARGVIEALNGTGTKKPIAVRMMGTNEKEGTRHAATGRRDRLCGHGDSRQRDHEVEGKASRLKRIFAAIQGWWCRGLPGIRANFIPRPCSSTGPRWSPERLPASVDRPSTECRSTTRWLKRRKNRGPIRRSCSSRLVSLLPRFLMPSVPAWRPSW